MKKYILSLLIISSSVCANEVSDMMDSTHQYFSKTKDFEKLDFKTNSISYYYSPSSVRQVYDREMYPDIVFMRVTMKTVSKLGYALEDMKIHCNQSHYQYETSFTSLNQLFYSHNGSVLPQHRQQMIVVPMKKGIRAGSPIDEVRRKICG